MEWYHWMVAAAWLICLLACLKHVIRLVRLGPPTDFSAPTGSTAKGIRYSMTAAMSPAKKETAYLHMPTYTAGILYHLGTFLGFTLMILLFFGLALPEALLLPISAFLVLTSLSGFFILIKRLSMGKMRRLSNADDYLSNFLVSLFQLATAFFLYTALMPEVYFILTALLLLYIPLGKLKHLVYFFAARYQLGFFYGWRAVWPPKKSI